MPSSLTSWVNLAYVYHLITVSGNSREFAHTTWMAALIHSIRGCVWLGAPSMSHLVFCNLRLNEGWVVIDRNHPVLSPEQIIPSTPLSQSCKSHATKGSPCFCQNCLPELTNSTWVCGLYVVDSVTLGAPWGRLTPIVLGRWSSLSAGQWASLPSGDPQSHNIHHHGPSYLTFKELGSSRPHMSCSSICGYNSSSHLCSSWTCTASCRALSISAFRAIRKIHPTVPVPGHATLSGKWELTTCNAFSGLSSDPSPASQSSTGTHTERAMATRHHILCGGHWLPPSLGASGSSTCWVSCWLCHLSGCSRCAHCSLNPAKARHEQGSWEKTPGGTEAADVLIPSGLAQQLHCSHTVVSCSWPGGRGNDAAITQLLGLFRWAYVFIEQGQAGTSWHTHRAVSDLSCYITTCLQKPGWEREAVEWECPTTAIWANLLFPSRKHETIS